MNHHYIDFMIRERRRQELEECARRRLLNSAGYHRTGLTKRVGDLLSTILQPLKKLHMVPARSLYTSLSMVHGVVLKKGGKR